MDEASIRRLCLQYTDLEEDEIIQILNMASLLQPMADIVEADVFIDCPMRDGDALVVAEAKPTKIPSSYKNPVVGLFARQENEPAVARTFRMGVGTRQMKATTQENGITIQTVEPIRSGEKIIGVLIQEKRENSDSPVNEKLHLSGEGYERIAESLSRIDSENNWLTECMDEALLLVNKADVIVFRNNLARVLFNELGYVGDIIGLKYRDICPVSTEGSYEGADGTYEEVAMGHTVVSIKQVRLNSEEASFAVLMRNITVQKQQEKELVMKSVAIREMHHRIKNSLQTVASLLRLQLRRLKSKEVQQVLSENMTRILSIADTHQLLAHEVSEEVLLREVLINIKNNALRVYTTSEHHIEITVEGDDFRVGSDIATSVALVVNELVQNALQHAFIDKEGGHIRIHVARGALYSEIRISDDGNGMEMTDKGKKHLGMMIVQSMVKEKLQGTLEIKSDRTGTNVSFQFINRLMKPVA